MVDFTRRASRRELMDNTPVDPRELERALRELEAINRWLGGYAPSIAGIASLLPAGACEFTLLDAGSGGGDVAARVASWARRRGLEARISGVDIDPGAVARARNRCGGLPGISFRSGDLLELAPEERFDVVHASLLLHHFPGAAAARALRQMASLSRLGLVVNDLHRHPLAYHAVRLLAGLFSRSALIRHDAPLSVLRAFHRREIEALARAAGLPAPEIRWRWAFRWQVVIRLAPARAAGPREADR